MVSRARASELIARFEGRPGRFYLYNVFSSLATVLFSEPKGGVWRFVFELSARNVHPWTMVSVLSFDCGHGARRVVRVDAPRMRSSLDLRRRRQDCGSVRGRAGGERAD
jgi:hypothetical protein